MIMDFMGISPKIDKDAFVAPSADVIGKVEIGKDSSIWFNVVIRGDVGYAKIGENTSIQDLSMLHMTKDYWLKVGDNVTVGHSVTLHGCEIGDNCLIGMGATILDNAKVGKNCIIGAGAVILENANFPDNSLIAGLPAKVKRKVSKEEAEGLKEHALRYVKYSKEYMKVEIRN